MSEAEAVQIQTDAETFVRNALRQLGQKPSDEIVRAAGQKAASYIIRVRRLAESAAKSRKSGGRK